VAVADDGATAANEIPLAARLASNALVQVVGSALSSAVSFFTFVAVTRGLGPSAFGDYTASLALIAVLVVLADLGLTPSVVREISAAPQRTEAVMRTSLPLRAILAGGVACGLVIFGLFAPLSDRLSDGILIGSLGAFATMLTVGLTPVLQARLMMQWAALANLVGRVVTLGLSLGVLALGGGFVGVVWANVLGLVATLLVTLAVVSRMISLRPVVDLAGWSALARGSWALALAIGLGQVYSRMDTLLLTLLRTDRDVGFYGAAYKFVDLASVIMAAVSVTVLPALSRFVVTNDVRLRELIQINFEVMLTLALPLTLLLSLYADEIVSLTSGSEYTDAAQALRVLAAYVPLMFVASIVWNILIAGRRERILVALSVGLVTMNVVLNLALIPRFGFQGAAYAAVTSEALGLLAGGIVIWRLQGIVPRLRHLRALLPSLGVMTIVILLVPGPWLVVAATAVTIYAAIILSAPGAIHESAKRVLRRRRSAIADQESR